MSEDRCIACGEIVPEGRMVCPICEKGKPTADVVEQKKGKWIKNDFYEDALMCSCCKAYLDKQDWSRHYYYYCYHCGAKMKKMDDGEEKTDDPR